MSCAKREYALIVCLGGLFSATVGFALSVFATLLSIFIPGPQRPILIETRDAAVKAASIPSSQSPSRSLSRDKSPLRLRLVTEASEDSSTQTETLSRLHSLVKDLPSISVSPAPTHSSFQSETSETNTPSTVASEFSITPTATTTEQRGRRRLRFSGFTQLFDKRSKTSPRSAALCPSSPSDPALASPASPPPPPRSPSLYRERPHKALVTRVKSCPGFHHQHHQHSARRSPGHSSTFSPPPLPLADHPLPLPPMPVPVPTTSPSRCRRAEKEKHHEPPAPPQKPRTQPYAAPYFALPPDSPPGPGVLPPIGLAGGARRRPGGRRMATG